MKTLFYILILASIFQSCNNAQSAPNYQTPFTKVIVIDNCEYVVAGRYSDFSGGVAIAHKGNCKNHTK